MVQAQTPSGPAQAPAQPQPAPAPQVQPQSPPPPPPPPPGPPPRPACLDAFDGVMDSNGVRFNYDSSDLRREDAALMDRVAEYARSCPQAHFKVDGYTDSSGSRRYNQDLSERRTRTVISELETRGVEPSRISPVVGHGESGAPEKSNWSRAGRQANRRVDIFMTE